MEGWQVWDLALACAGQLRIAPSGVVLGFDHAAVLEIATALDMPVAAVAILLPAMEAALVDAANAERKQDA